MTHCKDKQAANVTLCSDVSVWVMMAVACVGDGGSLGGCVWVRVEERMADRA